MAEVRRFSHRLALLVGITLATARAGGVMASTIQGKVDELKDPPSGLAAVDVTALDENGKVLGTALTDSAGQYIINGLPKGGTVRVEYKRIGYKKSPSYWGPRKLDADRTTAPAINMVKSQGDADYYAGVAREIDRLNAHASTAERKQLLDLVEDLDAQQRAMVKHQLRSVYSVEKDTTVQKVKVDESNDKAAGDAVAGSQKRPVDTVSHAKAADDAKADSQKRDTVETVVIPPPPS